MDAFDRFETDYLNYREETGHHMPHDEILSRFSIADSVQDSRLFQFVCSVGNLTFAQWLYTNRTVDINRCIDEPFIQTQFSPLSEAVFCHEFEVIRWLLTLPGIELGVRYDGMRPLCRAISSLYDDNYNDLEHKRYPMDIIDAFIERTPVSRIGDDEYPPLLYALSAPDEHKLPLVWKLVAAGADLQQLDADDVEPGSMVETILQNKNLLMMLHCFKECGVAFDCDSILMLAELAHQDIRRDDEEDDEEDDEDDDFEFDLGDDGDDEEDA